MTVSIPYHDFGGSGPVLHFSHPNAYTPPCFQQLVAPLRPHYHVLGAYHRPLWPGAQPEDLPHWRQLADDLIYFFEQVGLDQVIGVGHSMGAVTTMLAALKRPSLFRALVLIEPVFLPPALIEQATAYPDMVSQLPFIQQARRRRYSWPDRQAAFDHFRPKSAFKQWSDEALWDYVNYGMREDAQTGEIVLTYTREWEAHCYRLAAFSAWESVADLTPPTLAIRATESDTLFADSWALWQSLQPQATFIEMAGFSHMVIMERPLTVAQHTLDFLKALEM